MRIINYDSVFSAGNFYDVMETENIMMINILFTSTRKKILGK
jgi:hypothetical protein